MSARICAEGPDPAPAWRAAPERDSRACQPSTWVRPEQNRSAGDPGMVRPGGAGGRGARGADFVWGHGARGAGQRPPAPLPTLLFLPRLILELVAGGLGGGIRTSTWSCAAAARAPWPHWRRPRAPSGGRLQRGLGFAASGRAG